jgi:hypothetical protein
MWLVLHDGKALDQKDYIFGLHAVLQLFLPLPKPDYGKSVDQIFTETWRIAMETDRQYIAAAASGYEPRACWQRQAIVGSGNGGVQTDNSEGAELRHRVRFLSIWRVACSTFIWEQPGAS